MKMKRFLLSPISIFITTIIVASILIYGFKSSGIYIQGFKLVLAGEIVITEYDENIQIVLDTVLVPSNPLSEEDVVITNVEPGQHEIIVFKDGFWPWTKKITVESKESTIVSPFLVPKNVTGVIIRDNDPEYTTIRNTVLNDTLPTQNSPKISTDKTLSVWSDGVTIFAEILGGKTFTVSESSDGFRNIDFYQNRNDVLLISTQNGVFALEIDNSGGIQNFQPIYKGTGAPQFTIVDGNQIYVLDDGLIFMIAI